MASFKLPFGKGSDSGADLGLSTAATSGTTKEASTGITDLNRGQLMAAFWAAAALAVVLPRIPYGRNILYPFQLLGVWAHEMGHALLAVITPADFIELELYRGLGGVVRHAGAGRFAGVLISASGLLAPAFFGALIIIFSARRKTSRYVLPVISVMVGLSVLFFIRNLFGSLAMAAIAAVLIPIAFMAPDIVRVFISQMIGIQFCLFSWGSWDYLFTEKIEIDGRPVFSDTGQIQEALFLPYWFWGGLLGGLSVAMLLGAFYVAWIRPFRGDSTPAAV